MRSFLVMCGVMVLFAGCSTRPVLYPNSKLKTAGEAQAEDDIDSCIQMAEDAGADSDNVSDAASNAGRGAVAGAASGAISSVIIGGSVGRGTGAGAAAGATGSLLWGMMDSSPDPVFQNFVNRCLRDKGYDVTGWN